MVEQKRTLPSELGVVKIADEVVSIIAGIAVVDIEGVASMSGGVAGGIAEALGRRNLTKGVKVEVGTEEVKIDTFIIVEYGERIPDVSWNIQETVKNTVEDMTGLNVAYVNVHVQGIKFPQKEDEELEGEEPEVEVKE